MAFSKDWYLIYTKYFFLLFKSFLLSVNVLIFWTGFSLSKQNKSFYELVTILFIWNIHIKRTTISLNSLTQKYWTIFWKRRNWQINRQSEILSKYKLLSSERVDEEIIHRIFKTKLSDLSVRQAEKNKTQWSICKKSWEK